MLFYIKNLICKYNIHYWIYKPNERTCKWCGKKMIALDEGPSTGWDQSCSWIETSETSINNQRNAVQAKVDPTTAGPDES